MESMKQLVIDRLDGKYAICTDSDQKFYAIELPEVPRAPRQAASCALPTRGSFSWTWKPPSAASRAPRASAAGRNGKEGPLWEN